MRTTAILLLSILPAVAGCAASRGRDGLTTDQMHYCLDYEIHVAAASSGGNEYIIVTAKAKNLCDATIQRTVAFAVSADWRIDPSLYAPLFLKGDVDGNRGWVNTPLQEMRLPPNQSQDLSWVGSFSREDLQGLDSAAIIAVRLWAAESVETFFGQAVPVGSEPTSATIRWRP